MLNATLIRAHVHAAGDRKNGDQELGRSRDGLGTKIHAVCDGLGNTVPFLLTPDQTNDVTQSESLLEGLAADHVIADKGCDSDQVLQTIKKLGAKAVIPPKSNRKVQRPYDKQLDRERNHIERLFGQLKHCRRIATRYDKTARNFFVLLHLATTMILLASMSTRPRMAQDAALNPLRKSGLNVMGTSPWGGVLSGTSNLGDDRGIWGNFAD